MITEDYVSFETAKLLKEKGFNEACYTFYDSGHKHLLKFTQNGLCNNAGVFANNGICVAPTLQMAMKWLREAHGLHIDIFPDKDKYLSLIWAVPPKRTFDNFDGEYEDKCYPSYEKAAEAAIKYCLENLI